MKTLPIMIRVEPRKWQSLQKEASRRGLTAPQLVRQIFSDWLDGDRKTTPEKLAEAYREKSL